MVLKHRDSPTTGRWMAKDPIGSVVHAGIEG
jgi:hypothetical protein